MQIMSIFGLIYKSKRTVFCIQSYLKRWFHGSKPVSISASSPTRNENVYKNPLKRIVPDQIVDLRSDTATKPCIEMREFMAKAEVGDDEFHEDPTVEDLEERVAALLGQSSGLFVTSGTMGNLLAGLIHCNERGSEMIVGDQSHMFCYEQGNVSSFGGIHSYQIPNNMDGTFDIAGVVDRIRTEDHCHPVTKLIATENTHNKCGGRVVPLEWIDQLVNVGKEHGIPLHMDGARIFNASIATGIPVSRITGGFDSVSVCFSKGLGAPFGSVLVGNDEFISKGRRLRKGIGGGMKQAGILAAACLFSLDNMIDRLKDDHENAKNIAKCINNLNSSNAYVDLNKLETNILVLHVHGFAARNFCERLAAVQERERGVIGSYVSVKCFPLSHTRIRMVSHADITSDMAMMAAAKICYVIQEFAEKEGQRE